MAGRRVERVLTARVHSYRPERLDDLCLSGEVVWGRLSLIERAVATGDRPDEESAAWAGKTPSRRTPITFMLRQDLPWLLQAHRGDTRPAQATSGPGAEVLEALRTRGALFHSELQTVTGRLPTEIEEGLWDGVARGLITADGFNAICSLLQARTRFARRQRTHPRPGSRGRRGSWRTAWRAAGRRRRQRKRLKRSTSSRRPSRVNCFCAGGSVPRRRSKKNGWHYRGVKILRALRRLEARGLTRGGHFVTGITGEQLANEDTIPLLRGRRRAAPNAAVRRSA